MTTQPPWNAPEPEHGPGDRVDETLLDVPTTEPTTPLPVAEPAAEPVGEPVAEPVADPVAPVVVTGPRPARVRTMVLGAVLLLVSVLSVLVAEAGVDLDGGTVLITTLIGAGVLLLAGALRTREDATA